MKLKNLFIFLGLVVLTSSCKRCVGPVETCDGKPDCTNTDVGVITYNENKFEKDTDGDGVPETLQVLVADPVNYNPNTGYSSSDPNNPAEKRCPYDVERYCEDYGAQYGGNTALGMDFDEIVNTRTQTADADNNGVADYIEQIRGNATIVATQETAQEVATALSSIVSEVMTESLSEMLAEYNVPIAAGAINNLSNDIESAVQDSVASLVERIIMETIQSVVTESSTDVDYVALEEQIEMAVEEAIENELRSIIASVITAEVHELEATDTNLDEALTESALENIAQAIADDSQAEYILDSNNPASEVSVALETGIDNIEDDIQEVEEQAQLEQVANNPASVQGICPDGWHIPSDAEMKTIELFLGMPRDEVNLYGVENDRGASQGVGAAMAEAFNFKYGGYGSVNGGTNGEGSYAQLNEVEAFWTSTAGRDSVGDYIWIRYVDNLEHLGVLRKKHYLNEVGRNTIFNVRCIQFQ